MSVSNNNIASINDVKKLFVTNVINPVFSGANGSDSIPIFSGTSMQGEYGKTVAFRNPDAVPKQDMKNVINEKNDIINKTNFPAANSFMTGHQVYNAIAGVVNRLGNVRKYQSTWYRQIQENMVQTAKIEGKAVFNDSMKSLPTYRSVANTAVSGWERNTNQGTQTIQIDDLNLSGTIIKSQEIVSFFQNIYNNWAETYNNSVVYKFYTCHQNCHRNCHGSRGRR